MRRALSTEGVKFLTEEQALGLQAINGLRDAAQHHLVDISEGHLYLQAQSGITLHRDLLLSVFDEDLRDLLPARVMPIATIAPLDPINLFISEIAEVARLLSPGKRRHVDALARLRALSIVDGAMQGQRLQPSENDLRKLGTKISEGNTDIDSLFPGIAGVAFDSQGTGSGVALRITKREGAAVQLVQEGSADSSVVGVKRVAELDYYDLRFPNLVEKLGITTNQETALIALLEIKTDEDCSKKIINTWCYSKAAVNKMRTALEERPVQEWWQMYRDRGR